MKFSPLLFAADAVSPNGTWITAIVLLVMLAASAAVWIAWQRSNSLGRDFFGPRDFRSDNVRPWGQVVLLSFLVMFLFGVGFVALFTKELRELLGELPATERIVLQISMLRWSILRDVIVLAIVLGFSYWQVRLTVGKQVPWRGLIPTGRDLRAGVLLGMACVPLLLLLQGLLQYISQLFFGEQTEHPYIEMIRKNKDLERDLVYELLGWITVSVTLVAPILEELLFRGLLQGWLRGKYRAMTDKLLAVDAGVEFVPSTPAVIQRQRLITWAPIFIASSAFALAHAGHGTAPIPLFFFSLALGYLYEKTGRLAPSIIAHFLLNLCTSVLLWVAIMYRLPWD